MSQPCGDSVERSSPSSVFPARNSALPTSRSGHAHPETPCAEPSGVSSYRSGTSTRMPGKEPPLPPRSPVPPATPSAAAASDIRGTQPLFRLLVLRMLTLLSLRSRRRCTPAVSPLLHARAL
ncbi:hypothetical protein FKP32DRAFT_1590366 [Trametes sanguinea]|nr:hypothetical protein FKP32DRAFT_1590366 [Trametes sanguinea]